MIPSVPDFYEYAYGLSWFVAGRWFAGRSYRVESEALESYEKLTLRPRTYRTKPNPAAEAFFAFVFYGALWPGVIAWNVSVAFVEAKAGTLHIIKEKIFELSKFVFLGRRPRAERRKIEREQMQQRIKTLEKELELHD